ncbi:MAG TPA: PilZ domain-containing protein [Thermodesulfobacteriota bacterium]|nr:PilZ domain-containing protein [Thermodesulfobacteriota bacterium]
MISNGLQSVEKRKNPRKDFEVQLIANPLNTPYLIQGWVQNISFGGIGVKNRIPPSPFEKEEEVRFFIKKDDLVLSGEGKVVWAADMQGEVGIKFTRLADEMRSSLEKFFGLLA